MNVASTVEPLLTVTSVPAVALPEVLRFADDYRELVYAVLLVIMVRFMPGGLLGDDSPVWKLLVKIWRKFVPRKKTRADLIAEQAIAEGGQA